MRILLTGASGFIGATLAPALLAEGHELRGLTRDPQRARARSPARISEMEIVRGDVLTGEGLAGALAGVEVAYYLIHSMENTPGSPAGSFAERERVAASTFAVHARHADVSRIIYLGGLLPARGASRLIWQAAPRWSRSCWRMFPIRLPCAPRS